jgi:hypothetical protein
MIVRIMGEGQYRIDDSDRDNLNELDNAAVAAAESGDEQAFLAQFAALLDHVRSVGSQLAEDELEESDVLLPPADTTFAEAQREGQFTGDGLIPD